MIDKKKERLTPFPSHLLPFFIPIHLLFLPLVEPRKS